MTILSSLGYSGGLCFTLQQNLDFIIQIKPNSLAMYIAKKQVNRFLGPKVILLTESDQELMYFSVCLSGVGFSL